MVFFLLLRHWKIYCSVNKIRKLITKYDFERGASPNNILITLKPISWFYGWFLIVSIDLCKHVKCEISDIEVMDCPHFFHLFMKGCTLLILCLMSSNQIYKGGQ